MHLSNVNLQIPPYYVVGQINGSLVNGKEHYDTVYHRMRDFDLVNQLGRHITRNDLEGKVALVTFFHLSGQEAAPQLTAVLQKIQNTFAKGDSGLHILSITTMPREDSVPALKAYADHYKTDHDTWWFLHGSREQVMDIAKTDFQVELKKADSAGNALYSPLIILLDKHEYVRGYFNVMDSARVKRCVRDISLLMLESEKTPKQGGQ